MIRRINHMSFTVSDLEKSVHFYHNVLGLEVMNIAERPKEFAEKATGIKNARLRIAYLNGKNCAVELVHYLSPKGKKINARTCDIGSAHICFDVEAFPRMIKRLKENNVSFAGDPLEIPAGPNKGKRMVYIKDPDGNTLELIEAA